MRTAILPLLTACLLTAAGCESSGTSGGPSGGPSLDTNAPGAGADGASPDGAAPDVSAPEPTVTDLAVVVPSPGLPTEVAPNAANNNLDIVRHDGRLYLAFRTAPNHFASPDVRLHVVSTTDELTWRWEGTFDRGTDLREPRLLSWNGELRLYFAVLGSSPLDFEPQGAMVTRYEAPGQWTEPAWFGDKSLIPWRTKVIDGVPYLIGYTGGGAIYEGGDVQLDVHWLTTKDGETWEPVVPNQPIVHTGGGSETDFVILDDGTVIAVMRNEEGDADGFGSKICRAEAASPGDLTCAPDPRKYDSPLVFRHGGDVWLVGRRNLTETGAYDLGRTDIPKDDRAQKYQIDYWQHPKRCSLWRVDPVALEATLVLDLPSRGDTCFPSHVPVEGDPDAVLLYNYSSPVDGDDLDWVDGQFGPTNIYRQLIRF